jgi:hypothetical protein
MKIFFKLMLILCTAFLGSCKKDTERFVPEPLKHDGETLKATFEKEGYNDRLVDEINDSLYVSWSPSWNADLPEEISDSIQYVYIPLIPRLLNAKTNQEVMKGSVTGYGKYLVFKISNSYTCYLATYTSPDFRSHPVSLFNFTGYAQYEDLRTGKKTIRRFLNGIGL